MTETAEPLIISVCEACREALFPARALCTKCGGNLFRQEPAERGWVEAATEHRGVTLASVRTDIGPVVIARCSGPSGTEGALGACGGAPVAFARSS